MFEKEAEEYKDNTRIKDENTYSGFPDERISGLQDFEGNYIDISERIIKTFKDGAEFGYNKAKEEMKKQDYSLFDFVMQYENGKFKCKYKSGKVFESVDGEIWKEIVLPKESE